MTKYIDQLSENEEILLLQKLEYSPYNDGFRRGAESYHSEGYKIYHSFNHNYNSSKDYDDVYLCVSDYDVKSYNRQEKLKTLYTFMYDKFGEEWAIGAIKHLTGKKAMKSVQFIENLINNQKSISL